MELIIGIPLKSYESDRDERGFTLIEVVSVLVILGVLAAVVTAKGASNISDAEFVSQLNVIKNHMRYTQSKCMASGVAWHIKGSGSSYQLLDQTGTARIFPGEEDATVQLSAGLSFSAVFDLSFDSWGEPFNNGEVIGTVLNVNLTCNSKSKAIQVTPETGFIP